jgi:hypothetical protein
VSWLTEWVHRWETYEAEHGNAPKWWRVLALALFLALLWCLLAR